MYFLRPDKQMLVPVRVFLPVRDDFADELLRDTAARAAGLAEVGRHYRDSGAVPRSCSRRPKPAV